MVVNTVDSVDVLYDIISPTSIVVSGNSYITVLKNVTEVSGHALTSWRVSGATDLIMFRQGRNVTRGVIGGMWTEIEDYVMVDMVVHYPKATATSAHNTLRTRVNDFKVAVASGAFTNPPRPVLVGEDWSQSHIKLAKATLTYRFRYLL